MKDKGTSDSGLSKFWAELKRRKVVRVAIAYVAVGWLVVEVAATAFPRLGIPSWAESFILMIVILGFPIALILAWAFQLTAEGIKAEAGKGSSRYAAMAVAVIVPLVAVFVVRKALNNPNVSEKSIAVLAFKNFSNDPENEYFSDGLSDTLLHKLAQIQDLTVPARTSSFAFKNQDMDVREIGKQLNVAYVLEGSVQRSENQLRVIAQLIDTETGAHVESMTFDSQLADVFVIQDEIASRVVDSLRISLLDEEENQLKAHLTDNLAAYDEYLLGQKLLIEVVQYDAYRKAVTHFEKSTNLDPDFLRAYVGQSLAWMGLTDMGAEDVVTSTRHVRRLRTEITNRDPSFPDLHLIDAWLAWMGDDGTKAELAFQEHLDQQGVISGGYSYYWYPWFLMNSLKFADAIEYARRGLEIDPANPMLENLTTWAESAMGQYDLAIDHMRDIMRRFPDFADAYGSGANELYLYGDIPEAVIWAEKFGEMILSDSDLKAFSVVHRLTLKDWESVEPYFTGEREFGYPDHQLYTPIYQLERDSVEEAIKTANQLLRKPFQRWDSLVRFVRIARLDTSLTHVDVRDLYERTFPKLLNNRRFNEQMFNWNVGRYASTFAGAAVDYAGLLLEEGDVERAQDYIDDVETFISQVPRLGSYGYGILDVELAAIQGQKEQALNALEAAIEEGWMTDWWFHVNYNPHLIRFHNNERYVALVQQFEDRAKKQLDEVKARDSQ